jgi:Domain of unknown function (DUF4440)
MSARRLTSLALVFILSLLSTASLPARAGEDDAQQTLLQLERRWLEKEDDPDALETILANDFVHVLPLGFVTKAEQLRYMRTHAVPESGARHFEDLRVRIYGSAGVVTGIVVATGPDRKARKTVFTDVFAYRDGTWRAVNAQELPFGGLRHP